MKSKESQDEPWEILIHDYEMASKISNIVNLQDQ
jgi:hypothetical protein